MSFRTKSDEYFSGRVVQPDGSGELVVVNRGTRAVAVKLTVAEAKRRNWDWHIDLRRCNGEGTKAPHILASWSSLAGILPPTSRSAVPGLAESAGDLLQRLIIPAAYWDDYGERAPVDCPEQMATELRRAGNRVTIQADATQLEYLLGDATFYAEGNTDFTPAAVLRGARRVVELCAALASRTSS